MGKVTDTETPGIHRPKNSNSPCRGIVTALIIIATQVDLDGLPDSNTYIALSYDLIKAEEKKEVPKLDLGITCFSYRSPAIRISKLSVEIRSIIVRLK